MAHEKRYRMVNSDSNYRYLCALLLEVTWEGLEEPEVFGR
jgi:hypothetical protein